MGGRENKPFSTRLTKHP